MLSRISQFKQTLSDEFEQAVGPQRPVNDPVSVIERNARLLRTETPDVKDIMIESDGEEAKNEQQHDNAVAEGKQNSPPEAASGERAQTPQLAASNSAIEGTAAESQESHSEAKGSRKAGSRNGSQAGSRRGSEEEPRSGVENETKKDPESRAKDGPDTESQSETQQSSGISATEDSQQMGDLPPDAQAKEKNGGSIRDPQGGGAGETSRQASQGAEDPTSNRQSTPSNIDSRTSKPSRAPSPNDVPPAKASEPQSRSSIESQRPATADLAREPSPKSGVAVDDPQLAAKLAKFEKYEQKYPGLLKAYKMEKKKNELVRIYEKILSEHTPCTSIAEPQELVNYLSGLSSRSELQQKEIGTLQSDLTKMKSDLASEKKRHAELRQDFEQYKQQSEKQVAEARAEAEAHASAQLKADETTKLKEKLAALEQQLAESEAAGSIAARTQTTLRTQLDELGLRLAETQAELEVVRDELGDSERRAQERLQELSSVRNALRSRDKDRRRSTDEATAQIAVLTSEKEQLEAEVEQLGRRIVRETEQLHVQLRSVRSQLRESEAHAAELQQELDAQTNRYESIAPARVPPAKTPEPTAADTDFEVRSAQAQAEAAASGAVKANELLKQVNADNALRIEKLQKAQRALAADVEQLRSENQQLRRRSSSASSTTPSLDSEKQKAYLRNVLLGFIEHRDQRKMLLPVLATLLGFQDGEEERILNSLK